MQQEFNNTLQERIDYLSYVFELLQDTNSRLEKEQIVKDIKPWYREDFDYVIECLAGKHKFGYTYYKQPVNTHGIILPTSFLEYATVKQLLLYLQEPYILHNLTIDNIDRYVYITNRWYDFIAPIVNRTLRLGIGNSLLNTSELTPMLAKKYEGSISNDKNGYYITEKLDGNRCIAHYENGEWHFTSRNGKSMYVNFDMSNLPTDYIYDGEVLSIEQTQLSYQITHKIITGVDLIKDTKTGFNETSGLINRHNTDKKLIYNIFDIIAPVTYKERREELTRLMISNDYTNVRIVPVLQHYNSEEELKECFNILNIITDAGGEGIMINCGSADYLHKRTDKLLKLKKVYTMDMKVTDFMWGKGKYEGMVGALIVQADTSDGKHVYCSVGSGLSDEQRTSWAIHPELIINKIIEVSYFSLSQNEQDKGSNFYSLRFPRLKRIRDDKNNTSEF